MATILFANNAQTTLAGPISTGSTSVNLAAGTGALFPNPAAGQYFVMTFTDLATGLIHEIVNVTARSGDTLTITRAQESTTAVAWAANDIAGNWWTAGSAAQLVQTTPLQQQQGNFGIDTGTINNIVAALTPAPATLTSLLGAPIRIRMANTNTGATTLTLTPLASTAITNPDGGTMGANQLVSGHIFEFVYNGTSFDLMTAPYQLLSRANAWTGAQNYANNTSHSWNDSGGTSRPILSLTSANQVVMHAGGGTNPFVLVDQAAGTTIVYVDSSENFNVAKTLNVANGLSVSGAGNFGGTVTIAPATVGGNAARLDQIGLTVFTNIGLVTSSRALQTTYTNTTGKPMFVSVTAISTGPAGNLFIIVNGVTQYTFGQPGNASVTSVIGIVPATATYGVYFSVATFTLQAWTETY